MERRIAEAFKATVGDQGSKTTTDHSQHTAITINGGITIQITLKKSLRDTQIV